MNKHTNFSLKNYNTFGIDAKAETFVEVNNLADLTSFFSAKNKVSLLLGGGSNMLLTQDVAGTVLHVNLSGKKVISETETHVIIEAQAGENWHETVLWALENNWGGIENLSLIPGNIGTAPIQNIGAYGVELKDVFHQLTAVDIATGKTKIFSHDECAFGYRDSVFKNKLKNKFVIAAVQLKLTKAPHRLSTHYGAINQELEHKNIANPSIADISAAVIAIRQSKLPNPAEIGNSGSFFKNPILPTEHAKALKEKHTSLPIYPAGNNKSKIAAGWLIEQAGWKGYRTGDAGVHKKQALVLVNYGNATGTQIWELANQIIENVHEKFGIKLSPEVNII